MTNKPSSPLHPSPFNGEGKYQTSGRGFPSPQSGEGMKGMRIGFWILIFGFLALASGCGQQETATTTTSTTSTTIPASVTIRGTLATGNVFSAGVRASGIAGYNVVVIDNSSGQTYNTSSDASGNFSLTIPGGSSYEVSLIDANSQYFGPVVMVGNASSSEVITGIAPNANANLGQINVDTAHGVARPTAEPTSIANFMDTALASGGIPKGAGNDGKTTLTGISTRAAGADRDKDGIPNVFDADEDNDGIRNGIISTPFGATVSSNTVESVFLSSNIWALHGTTDEAKDSISLWVNVCAKSGKLGEIQSAQCINVPASIKDVATVRFSESLGSPESYPAENSLWKNASYNLYKTTTLQRNQWIISLCPRAIMNVGDIFVVRVTYIGGGYQDFFILTAYVLTDWARVLSYNGITMPTLEGTNTSPVTFSDNNLRIIFSKPRDEDGNVLDGLRYSIRVGTCEAHGGTYPVPSNVTETHITDPGDSFTTIEAVVSTVTAETYYVTPVAESADGQRNGEETWFRKQ